MDTYFPPAHLIEALLVVLETIKLIMLGALALYLILAILMIVSCRRELRKGKLNAMR